MKTVKMRLTAVFLLMVASLLMAPVAVFAEIEMTGPDFLAKAQDGVITLDDDVVLTSTATIRSDLTIKLNGHTLKSGVSDELLEITGGNVSVLGPGTVTGGQRNVTNDLITVKGSSHLTMKGSSGTRDLIVSGFKAVDGGGDVGDTIEAGAFDGNDASCLTIENAIVSGGVFHKATANGYDRSAGDAICFYGTGVLSINNSEVSGGDGTAASDLTGDYISGGQTFASGGLALSLYSGTVFVQGSTLYGGDSHLYNAGHAIEFGNGAGLSLTIKSSAVTGGSCMRPKGTYGISGDAIAVTQNVGPSTIVIGESNIVGGGGGNSWRGSGINVARNDNDVVKLSASNSVIMGGARGNGTGGGYGNAIYASVSQPEALVLELSNVNLSASDDAYDNSVIYGIGGKTVSFVAAGTIKVTDGCLKNVDVTLAGPGARFEAGSTGVAEVGKNNLEVKSSATVDRGGAVTYFPTATDAIGAAVSGSTVTVTQVNKGEVLPAPPVGVEVENNTGESIVVGGNTVEPGGTVGNYVAMVGDRGYVSLTEAIAAAKVGGTVDLLVDVTVDTWQQVWDVNGLTINGGGHKVTIGKVESASNGDYLFFGADNLTVSDLSVTFETNGNGFSLSSGKLNNVTMTGGPSSKYAVFVDSTTQDGSKVVIDGCSFTGFSGAAIYSQPGTGGAKTSDLVVNNTTIKDCGMAMCSYAQNTTFTNNTVTGGSEVSFAGAVEDANRENSYVITGNKFDSAGKIWFYGAKLEAVEFEGNKVLGSTVVSTEDAALGKLDVSKNYWGGDKPGDNQIVGDKDNVTGTDVYYEKDSMKPEDLNTYVPPVVVMTYKVSVKASDHGKVKADVSRAESGKTVTLAVTADKGFELTKLSVVDASGKNVAVTKGKNGTYTFTMPAADITVEASFGCDGGALCPSKDFVDVDTSEWYHAAIDWAVANDVLNGIGDTGRMNPLGKLTRAQMAAILYNVEGSPAVDIAAGDEFSDFDSSAWYAKAVAWTAVKDLFQGYGTTGVFGANDVLTREQAAAVLMRWSAMNGRDVTARADLSVYPDSGNVSVWAKDCMSWAVAEGMINGIPTSGGVFELRASGTATRAQAASLMMNLVDK